MDYSRKYRIALFLQPLLVGFLSSFVTRLISREVVANSSKFRVVMDRSFIYVPSYIFPIVWTILYILMGYAIYLVSYRENSIYRSKALIMNQIQLFFNFAWMIIYFGFNRPSLAFIDIQLLIFSTIITTYLYKKIDNRAHLFMVPYLCWLTFALYLNFLAL